VAQYLDKSRSGDAGSDRPRHGSLSDTANDIASVALHKREDGGYDNADEDHNYQKQMHTEDDSDDESTDTDVISID